MKFNHLFSIIESKINSLEQLKGLVTELENEIKFMQKHHDICQTSVQKRYARIANRVVKDLKFDAEDFAPDDDN
ncbi:MAG: hypothetical protein HUU57_10335 [Bdellovibrio sp.]|nr:hypothetical protein [Bdellovibrio sp.]